MSFMKLHLNDSFQLLDDIYPLNQFSQTKSQAQANLRLSLLIFASLPILAIVINVVRQIVRRRSYAYMRKRLGLVCT